MLYHQCARWAAKWRSFLVYLGLHTGAFFLAQVIHHGTALTWVSLYANLAGLATGLYCLANIVRLLVVDREGDDGWPPLWPRT